MQVNRDADHPNPATIILNADLLGEWQKGLNTHFEVAFGDPTAWKQELAANLENNIKGWVQSQITSTCFTN
jgi:hypothetical protein